MAWIVLAEDPKKQELIEWAQDAFRSVPIDWDQVTTKGQGMEMPADDIEDAIDTLKKITASHNTEVSHMDEQKNDGPQPDDSVRVGDKFDVVPGSFRSHSWLRSVPAGSYVVLKEYPIKDLNKELFENPSDWAEVVVFDNENEDVGTATVRVQELLGLSRHQSSMEVSHMDEQKDDRPQPGDTIVVGRDITVGRVMKIQGEMVHLRTLDGEMTVPMDKLYRAASTEYPDFNQLKDITIRAMTTYTDMASTARAAHLMGETTRQFWAQTVAKIKKECGAAIEADVEHLCKWGTVRPSVASVKDVVMKHIQAKGIYPYPEIVVGLIAAMPNPLQDRLIGPEGTWPISEPR